MNRQRRPLAALALIAVVALVAACGSSGRTTTAAGTSTGSGGSGGGGTAAANAQKALTFAECMRHNGVSNFPDPGASGNFTIDAIANGSSLDTNSPAFKQAIGTCKALEPAGFTGSKRSPQQQQAALEFARCIRANGVPDFPDPTPNGPLIDTNRIRSAGASGGARSIPGLEAAAHKCGSIYAGELGLRGR